MANRADVFIKNVLKGDIRVYRQLPDGGSDSEAYINKGNEVMIPLQGTDVGLVIHAPEGMDIKNCPVRLKSDVDLEVSCSRTKSHWTFKIVPNELPPDAPTTVNIEVGPPGEG